MKNNSILFGFIFCFCSSLSQAEEPPPPVIEPSPAPPAVSSSPSAATPVATNSTGRPSSGKKRQVKINFEDELVRGSTETPDLLLLSEKMPYSYKKMIRIREHFQKELENGKSDFSPND